jgi:hypothetical protein
MLRTSCVLLVCLAVAVPAFAKKASVSTQREFRLGYTDERGKARTARFSLDAAAVREDLDTPLGFPYEDAVAAQVAAARRFARSVDGVEIKVRAGKKGISIGVSGRDRKAMKAAMRDTEAAADAALEDWMVDHGWTRHKRKLLPDHAALVVAYSDDLRPLAEALSSGLDLTEDADRRAFARRALSLVQDIPYEKRKGGGDKGYRRPLAVLAKNRGDCDSKTVLYLAILRAAMPRLDAAVVYIPQHTFGAVGLAAEPGEVCVRVDGEKLVMVEPVGPAQRDLGDGGRRSKARARGGAVRTVAVAKRPLRQVPGALRR